MPSLDVLTRLAELYECRVADLITDCPDYRYLDQSHPAREQLSMLPELAATAAADSTQDAPGAGIPDTAGDQAPGTAGCERTSPVGYYRGATHHGTIQLIISPASAEMSGRWLGFGKSFTVNTGEWVLTRVETDITPRALRKYHHRL